MGNALQPKIIRIHLDTSEPFNYRLGTMIIDGAGARLYEDISKYFANGESISLLEVGEGTWWAHLMVVGGGAVAFAGGAVLAIEALAKDVREGNTPFSRGVAGALDEGKGSRITFSVLDEQREVKADDMAVYPPPPGIHRATWAVRPSEFTSILETDKRRLNPPRKSPPLLGAIPLKWVANQSKNFSSLRTATLRRADVKR